MAGEEGSWLANMGRLLTGRKKSADIRMSVDPGDQAITKATRELGLDLINEDPSAIRFKPKEIVVWKWGMKNKSVPFTGQSALIMRVRDEPMIDETQQPSSTYHKEPLDVLLGVYTHEGIFREVWVDGRRICHRADRRAAASPHGTHEGSD